MDDIHVIAVFATLAVVLYADYYGSRWFRGKIDSIPENIVERMHIGVSVGLAALILTGGLMFIDRADYLMAQPVFWAKMAFVAALAVNGFFIGRISSLAVSGPFKNLTQVQKRWVLISGGVSAIGWVSAVLLGLVLAG